MDRIDRDNPLELRRKLGKRLGLAALLIVILLVALAAFDYLSQLEREDSSQPVPPVQPRIGPSIISSRPIESAAPDEEPVTPSPDLAPLPPAEVAAQPTVTSTPPAPPLPAPTALPQSAAPVPPPPKIASVPSPVQPAPPAAVPEDSSSAPVLGAPASARLPVPASGRAAPPPPVLSRLAAGFVLQAGVFTSTERAEELKARLLLAGVPVTIESRVQVGPFASQREANAARKKIRELGIESILIPPRAGRR